MCLSPYQYCRAVLIPACCITLILCGFIIIPFLPHDWDKGVCISTGEFLGPEILANYFSLSDEVVLNPKWNPIPFGNSIPHEYIHPKIGPHPNGSASLCYFKCLGYDCNRFERDQIITYRAIWEEEMTPFLENEITELIGFILLGIVLLIVILFGIACIYKYIRDRSTSITLNEVVNGIT